jgi:dipeptide transport system ATP-binding protein
VLKVENLEKTYFIPQAFRRPLALKALRGVSFSLQEGKTLAVVGESGCGKSTLAKVLMQLEEASQGRMTWHGQPVKSRELMQMVFQDPSSSLNPRKKIFDSIGEPLKIRGYDQEQIREKVFQVAGEVGLRPEWLNRYPHMLSGGQKQRVGIARALITQPKVIICDEPVSALDVSVQAQVLNLLLDLQKQHRVSYVFISHDLNVVRFIADHVAVLYLGKIVEMGTREDIFNRPRHPYTQMLLRSVPRIGEPLMQEFAKGDLPSPLKPPPGCAFQTRCPIAEDRCRTTEPALLSRSEIQVACHRVNE